MWYRNGLRLKDESSVAAHQPKPDWQGTGRNLSPFHVKLEGGSSKTSCLFPVSHFQNNHSSEESSRAHQPGKTSNRWRIKTYFTEGAVRLRKSIQPREGCKHQDGEKLFTNGGATHWFRKSCSRTGPTSQNNFSASQKLCLLQKITCLSTFAE